jgi:hypothetical protein
MVSLSNQDRLWTRTKMALPPIDPEKALPWQKLAAALADLVGGEPVRAGSDLDEHEARVQATADLLIGAGIVDPALLKSRMAQIAQKLSGDKDWVHPKARFSNARPNDIGGLPGGPVDPSGGHVEPWEMLVTVVGMCLRERGINRIDEGRRASEDLGDDYHRLGYFERMAQGGANLLYEKGILTREEVEKRIAEIKARS